MSDLSGHSAEPSLTAADPSTPRDRRPGRWALLILILLLTAYGGFQGWRWWAVAEDAPVIGVSYDTAWHARAGITTKNYEVALTRIGARILELDPARDEPERILEKIDALLLTGGGDVDPRLYGGDPQSATLVDRQRDDFEIAMIRGALERDLPILGICRGIQILNVGQGGTLQNLRRDPARSKTHGIDWNSMAAHPVEVSAASRLAGIVGAGTVQVNSFHGQAVADVAGSLRVAATASDGVIEALEHPARRFVVTLQWHPEVPPAQMQIWQAFFEEAVAYRTRCMVPPSP